MGKYGQNYLLMIKKGLWRKNARPSVPVPSGTPIAPAYLTDLELDVWSAVLSSVAELNILDTPDVFVLAQYCQIYCRYNRLMERIRKDELSFLELEDKFRDGEIELKDIPPTKPHPYSNVVKDLLNSLFKIQGDLGLTPKSRMQLNITQRKEMIKNDNDLEDEEDDLLD